MTPSSFGTTPAPTAPVKDAGADPKALTSTGTAPAKAAAVKCPHCGKDLPAHYTAGTVGHARIKIDGIVKTFQGTPTGAALHKMAGAIEGFPSRLKSGGSDVPNNDEPIAIAHDQEFVTDNAPSNDAPLTPKHK